MIKPVDKETYVLFYFIEVSLIYNIVLVSGVQQSVLLIHTHTHILVCYCLLQDTECSSLCCTVGPSCLFKIPHISGIT